MPVSERGWMGSTRGLIRGRKVTDGNAVRVAKVGKGCAGPSEKASRRQSARS